LNISFNGWPEFTRRVRAIGGRVRVFEVEVVAGPALQSGKARRI
jgi:hypothetical protein